MGSNDIQKLLAQCSQPAFLKFLDRCHPDQKGQLTRTLDQMRAGHVNESDVTGLHMAMDLASETEWWNEGGHLPQSQIEEVGDADRAAMLHPQRNAGIRRSVHVYGHSSALCLEPTVYGEQTTGIVNDPTTHTVTFEMARRKVDGPGYDWGQKIQFRLTRRELPLAVAVMFGLIPDLTLTGHGPAHDKQLDMRNQPGRVYIRLAQRTATMSLPISHDDLFMVGARMLEALVNNVNGLDASMVMQLVNRVANVYNEAKHGG